MPSITGKSDYTNYSANSPEKGIFSGMISDRISNRKDGIEQVAFRCGYEDVDYFRKIFKRYVSMTPKAYQEKYGRK
jgi:hypothetical protein